MKKLFLVAFVSLLLFSCASNKNIPYFRNIPSNAKILSDTTLLPKSIRIDVGDILSITVSTLDPTAALPFNLPLVSYPILAQNNCTIPQVCSLILLTDKEI